VRHSMADLLLSLATVAFFALAILFTRALDHS
jgi:hypothetical protein